MNKVAIVYFSGTGNTEIMAKAVLEGVNCAGKEGVLISSCIFNRSDIESYEGIAFGCPPLGAEALEEYEFEPMFANIESSLLGKRIFLFGSYGWGNGKWMDEWRERCTENGAILVCEPVICKEEPDERICTELKKAGKILAEK